MFVSRKTINSERQSKPTLIVRDLVKCGVEPGQVYESLLKRGVFKWFSVRRDMLALEKKWRERLTASIEKQREMVGPNVNYQRGYRKALEECRAELIKLQRSESWRAPSNDALAERWLSYYNDILGFKTNQGN